MKTMRLSVKVTAGVLLAWVASPALSASQHDQDRCGANTPGLVIASCIRIDRTRGETGQNRAAYFEGDAAATIEMIRLDSKDPDARHGRGGKDQAKSDLGQTIAYYNAAIKLDPKDDDAYFHRALANFYAGSLPKALADLSQASKLDPKYPYYALWTEIVDKRGNLASHFSQAIAQIDMNKWPAPVIRLFLGQATPEAVLAAADDRDPKTKRGQLCEANFYVGEATLQQGAKDEATRLFRLAAADCPHEFVEGISASAELETLSGSQ
jgi:tetratricopeptide (TPR) repeat protein